MDELDVCSISQSDGYCIIIPEWGERWFVYVEKVLFVIWVSAIACCCDGDASDVYKSIMLTISDTEIKLTDTTLYTQKGCSLNVYILSFDKTNSNKTS